MPQRAERTEDGRDRLKPPDGVVLRPPVTIDDLKAGTENDPEGAEEFVALIRTLRNEDSRSAAR